MIANETNAERKQAAEVEATSIMERAVTHVKIYHPFYGALLHKLRLKLDWRHSSLYVDAVVIGFNPEWVMKAQWERLIYVLVHCVTHCAMRHPFRRGDREEKLYGEATDHVVNLALIGDESLAPHLPPVGSIEFCGEPDERFKGKAVEEVYSILYSEQPPKQKEKTDENQQKQKQKTEMKGLSQSRAGDVGDAGASGEPIPKEEEDEEKEEEKKGKGKNKQEPPADQPPQEQEKPEGSSDEGSEGQEEEQQEGDGEGEVEEEPSDEPLDEDDDLDGEDDDEGEGEGITGGDLDSPDAPSPADLAQLEREWGEAVMTAVLAAGGEINSSMQRQLGEASKVRQSFEEYVDVFAARCFADEETWKRSDRRFSDSYLPSRSQPAIRKLLVGVDTSGSINDVVLRKFETALQRIGDTFGCAFVVAYCDTRIRKEEEFQRGETIDLKPEGGGGTRFAPIFSRYRELEEAGEDVAGVIYLTDLEGHVDGWQKYMDIETLWVATETDPEKLYLGMPKFGAICNIHD